MQTDKKSQESSGVILDLRPKNGVRKPSAYKKGGVSYRHRATWELKSANYMALRLSSLSLVSFISAMHLKRFGKFATTASRDDARTSHETQTWISHDLISPCAAADQPRQQCFSDRVLCYKVAAQTLQHRVVDTDNR
ncbi:MAG TPA: hypothetical protein DEF45_15410 [Rhodopirellula sp.]|nr:hypothetical protein [Rhodopirellula sp.]